MQLLFFSQKLFHRLYIHFIRHTAIHGTNSRTLRLLMETLALRTFIRDDIIGIDTDGSITLAGIYDPSIQ
jgi:hypothetical protein